MNLYTPLTGYTGYGITGYNIWKELNQIDENLCLFIIGDLNRLEETWDKHNIIKSLQQQNRYNPDDPYLKIWHGNDFFLRPSGRSMYAGLSFFELDTLTEKELLSYSLLDKIIVPSHWAKNILLSNNIKKDIIVCPMGVDTQIFNGLTPADKLEEDKYIFINIGKWEIRKGHDVLVNIFNQAFNRDDNVELWMVNHNPFVNQDTLNQWGSFYKDSPLGEKIKIYPRLPNQHILARVMAYTDCGIFPSRGEGWNNEAIEMMAMNKPVIITNYSAHTEYCNKNNSYLINISSTTPAIDGIWFNGEGNWASFDNDQIEQAIEHMRYVYKNNIRSNPKGLSTANDHSWAKTAKTIYNYINDK